MISARYAPAMLVVTALALVPVVIHSYVGLKNDDGRRASAISPILAGFMSHATDRRASWGEQKLQSHDWIERVYNADTGQILVFVARSYDPKRLYHHPELAVLYGKTRFANDFEAARIHRSPQRSAVPVHVLRARLGRPGVAGYALQYDGRFVDNPYVLQANMAFKLLASGRKPMTLFLVYDPTLVLGDSLERSNVLNLLFAAIDSFEAQSSRGL
jgi:hypothetical protein